MTQAVAEKAAGAGDQIAHAAVLVNIDGIIYAHAAASTPNGVAQAAVSRIPEVLPRPDGRHHRGPAPHCDLRNRETTLGPDSRDTAPKCKERALLSYASGRQEIRFRKRPCPLTSDLRAKLVHFLYDCQAYGLPATYKSICEKLWPGDTDKPKDAPDKLRTLIHRLNVNLTKALGPPPEGRSWIYAGAYKGYALNESVTWAAMLEWKQRDHVRPFTNYDFSNTPSKP
jgi:hypothetical protein